MSAQAGVASSPVHAVAVVPTDFDNRRDVDLLVLRDDGAPQLFQNMRDGTFTVRRFAVSRLLPAVSASASNSFDCATKIGASVRKARAMASLGRASTSSVFSPVIRRICAKNVLSRRTGTTTPRPHNRSPSEPTV